MNGIPQKIHYCWFGGNPLPELAEKCIDSWKKFFPDYEIIQWNENNYNVRKIPYISEAYDKKKYAFVSDYARFDILYQYGGVYFDTDVEVIKDFAPIINAGAFAGVERVGAINAGLGLASPAALEIFADVLESYKDEHFVNQDGSFNLKTIVTRVSDVFYKYGFVKENIIQDVAGVRIYPTEYFCPKNYETGKLDITKNSYSIHHYDGSWFSDYENTIHQKELELSSKKKFVRYALISLFKLKVNLKEYGVVCTLRKIWK